VGEKGWKILGLTIFFFRTLPPPSVTQETLLLSVRKYRCYCVGTNEFIVDTYYNNMINMCIYRHIGTNVIANII